jgi:hypothetical protein
MRQAAVGLRTLVHNQYQRQSDVEVQWLLPGAGTRTA